MSKENRKIIVDELVSLIDHGTAHASFEDTVKGVPMELLTKIPDNLPYSVWQLTEHIRITQWDILEFSKGPGHQSPKWPDEYWPAVGEEISKEKWENTLKAICTDREAFLNLLKEEENDLYKPFSYGEGQSLLKEALQLADHTSYHLGEIIVVRRLLNDWKS